MFIKRLIMFVLLSSSLLLFGCSNTKEIVIDEDPIKLENTRLQISNSNLEKNKANLEKTNFKLQSYLLGLRDKNKSQITALGYLDVELRQTESIIVGIEKKIAVKLALLESEMHELQTKMNAIISKTTRLGELKEQFGIKIDDIKVIKAYIINDLMYPENDLVISTSDSVLLTSLEQESEKSDYLHQKVLFAKQLGIEELNLLLEPYKEKKEGKIK